MSHLKSVLCTTIAFLRSANAILPIITELLFRIFQSFEPSKIILPYCNTFFNLNPRQILELVLGVLNILRIDSCNFRCNFLRIITGNIILIRDCDIL